MTYLSDEFLASGVHSASGELNAFGGHANLIVGVGAGILHLNIKLLLEILLQSVQEDVVVILRDARITNKEARSLFQNTSDLSKQTRVNMSSKDERHAITSHSTILNVLQSTGRTKRTRLHSLMAFSLVGSSNQYLISMGSSIVFVILMSTV